MPRSGHYVDNAQNRSLGRVGMAYGSHSGGGSSSSSLGSSSSSAAATASFGFSYSSSSSGSCSGSGDTGSSGRTYVDNPLNRSLGRVGMEHGTAVHSRSCGSSGSGGSGSSSNTYVEYGTASHSSQEEKVYKDNAMNRKLERVGLPLGSKPHTKGDSSVEANAKVGASVKDEGNQEEKVYKDNAMNRKLERVGLPLGSKPDTKGDSSVEANAKVGASVEDEGNEGKKVYKDNALNRKLERVGHPLGSKPQRKADDNKGATPREETPARNGDGAQPRVYVDNAFNRKHNRVGLPLGSRPISRKNEIYQNNAVNRHLGRVGKPVGSCPVTKKELSRIRKILKDNQDKDGDIPAPIEEMYEQGSPYIQDYIEQVLQYQNRQEECEHETWDPHQRTPASVVESCRGNNIKYKDLDIRKIIGHGGFGEVKKAKWNNEVVAVKILKNQNLIKKHRQQFVNEVEIFCQLDHENITYFIGFCNEPPNFAIVMEYMDMSLFDAIHIEGEDLDSNSKVVITRNIIFGLTYLHAKEIAHCDLKTQNVLLNNVPGTRLFDESKPILAKLTDFGLSTMKANSETSTSASSGIRGTPKYAAPEVLRGEILELRKLLKADVYSLGLVIFELALEEIPFDDFNLTQLIEHVGRKGLIPEPSEGLKLDKFVKEQLDKCFSSDPDKRPTANELADAALDMTSLVEEEEE